MQLQKKNTYMPQEKRIADEKAANQGMEETTPQGPEEDGVPAGDKAAPAAQPAVPSAPSDAASLGALLRSAREARGLSLADAANALKLGEDALLAIEDGRYEVFPHKAYARGFLRSYAKFLKVESEACKPVLDLLSPTQEYDAPVYTPERAARPRRHRPWIGVLASLLMACLIGFAVWYFNLMDLVVRETSDEPQTVAPMPSSASPTLDRQMREREENVRRAQAERAQSQASTGVVSSVNPNLPQGASSLAGNMQSPAQATPGKPRGAGSSVSEGTPTLSPESGVSGINSLNPNLPQGVNPAAQAQGTNTVVVVAETMCWTSVTVDNARSVQRTLQAGESLTLSFAESLRLRLGNAGGVRVFYNGRELDRGRQGQVRNWNFPLTPEEMPN